MLKFCEVSQTHKDAKIFSFPSWQTTLLYSKMHDKIYNKKITFLVWYGQLVQSNWTARHSPLSKQQFVWFNGLSQIPFNRKCLISIESRPGTWHCLLQVLIYSMLWQSPRSKQHSSVSRSSSHNPSFTLKNKIKF